MLATITLATRYGWFGTWLGSTLGMVAADALAILVGRLLGRHLPERAIKYGASGLFFLFGIWLLVDASAQLNRVSPIDVIAGALNHHLAGWTRSGSGSSPCCWGCWAAAGCGAWAPSAAGRRGGWARRDGGPAPCSPSPCCSGSVPRCWSRWMSCSRSRCSTSRAGSRAGARWCCWAPRC